MVEIIIGCVDMCITLFFTASFLRGCYHYIRNARKKQGDFLKRVWITQTFFVEETVGKKWMSGQLFRKKIFRE